MTFTYEMNKLLLVDGALFILPGIMMMLSPNPQRLLKDKLDSKNVIPPFKEVRRLLGAAFLSMGIMMVVVGGSVHDKAELNDIAKFRSISLVFILYASILQMTGKKWKFSGTQVMYLFLYALLFLAYVFLGFVDPMPA